MVPKVSPPASPPTHRGDPPTTFLIYNIPDQLAAALLNERVWSSTRTTFEIRPVSISIPPSLLFCLGGFTTTDMDTIKSAVRDKWMDKQVHTRIAELLCQHDPKFQVEDSEHFLAETISAFASSVTVELVEYKARGGLLTPCFNILSSNPPSNNPFAWTEIRNTLQNLTYPLPDGWDGDARQSRRLQHLPLLYPPHRSLPLPTHPRLERPNFEGARDPWRGDAKPRSPPSRALPT